MKLDPHRLVNSHRARVLVLLDASEADFTAAQVATHTGLTYKQTIDALNALLNQEQVTRTGRKFTAKWSRLRSKPANPTQALVAAFARFFV